MGGVIRTSAKTGLFVIAFLFALTGYSQSAFLQIDRPLYIPGETVLYALHLPESLAGKPGAIKASWYDPQGNPIASNFMPIEAVSSGSFKIPYELASGFYRIQFTVQLDWRNKILTLLEAPIPIYSLDLIKDSATWEGLMRLDPSVETTNSAAQKMYNARDTISIQPPGLTSSGSMVSVAIRDQELFQGIDLPTVFSAQIDPSIEPTSSLTVSGVAHPPLDRRLLTFKLGDRPDLIYASTNFSGKFKLRLPDFYEQNELQFIHEFSDSESVEFDESKISEYKGNDLPATRQIKKYLEFKSDRTTIYSLFNQLEPTPVYEGGNEEIPLSPDMRIETEKYNVPDFKTFCREVAVPLKYSNRSNSFGMFNPLVRDMRPGTPLFIVDGQLTRNHDYLVGLEFHQLKEILLFYDEASISDHFGFAGYSGVVVINSKLGNLKVPQALTTSSFLVQGYMKKPTAKQTLTVVEGPVLTPMVYWGVLDALPVNFRHSHDLGVFEAEIVYVSGNRIQKHTVTYQVK